MFGGWGDLGFAATFALVRTDAGGSLDFILYWLGGGLLRSSRFTAGKRDVALLAAERV